MRLTDEDVQRHKENIYSVECVRGKVKMSDGDIIHNLCDTIEALQQENEQLQIQAQEFAKAKVDGRLVELPCKVGDIGWQITECFDGDRGCQGNCDECPKKKTVVSFRFISKAHIVRHVEKGDFSKTVFLTREAAEKAIAEVGNEI